MGCIKYTLTTRVVPRISLLIVAAEPIAEVPTLREYYRDLDSIIYAASDGESKSFAYKRLQYLDGKWNLYILLNERQEMLDSKVTSISSSIKFRREYLIATTTTFEKSTPTSTIRPAWTKNISSVSLNQNSNVVLKFPPNSPNLTDHTGSGDCPRRTIFNVTTSLRIAISHTIRFVNWYVGYARSYRQFSSFRQV